VDDVQAFLHLLRQHPCGYVWLASLAYGLQHGHCQHDDWRDVVLQAAKSHARALAALAGKGVSPPPDPDLAWGALDQSVKTRADRPLPQPPAQDAPPPVQHYTHVTSLVAMETHHFSNLEGVQSGTLSEFIGTDGGTRLQIIHERLQAMLRAGRFELRPSASLGYRRLWVSAEPLQAAVDHREAGHQRDRRGLVHYASNELLVGYVLDAARLPPPCRPAVVDGAGVRFRAWSDEPAGDALWGRAVHLERLAQQAPQIDGATEAVVRSVPLDLGTLLDLHALGHPGGGTTGPARRGLQRHIDDDAAYAARIEQEATRHGVDVPTLVAQMEEELGDL